MVPNFIDLSLYKIKGNNALRKTIASDNEKILIHISNFRRVKNVNDVYKPAKSVIGRKSTSGLESTLQKANSVKLIQTAEGLSYEADGFVGFEITLSHGPMTPIVRYVSDTADAGAP